MTGSFGMLSMPAYLQHFRNIFSSIKVIMTESAKEFIPEESLSLIVGPIYSRLFPLSSTPKEFCHVQLARWADLFIVLPATANILAEAAHGTSSSLLSSTILCYQKPIIFVPSMNKAMWDHPATQRNISILKEYGHKIIAPKQQMGFEYASGAVVEGKYAPPLDEILQFIREEINESEAIFDENWLHTP